MFQADDGDFQRRLQHVEVLLQAAHALPDLAARDCVRELIRSVLELHREGLAKMWDIIAQEQSIDKSMTRRLADDPLVSSLLLLHELHPTTLEDRVAGSMNSLRPILAHHGVDFNLVEVSSERVHVKLFPLNESGECLSRGLIPTIEEAILAVAPDVAHIQIEEPAGSGNHFEGLLISLPVLA